MIRTVAFRVDSSLEIGSGHVMRCLNLAEEFQVHGIESFFISRELPGHSIDLILKKQFKVYCLPNEKYDDAKQTSVLLKKISPIDYVIVDHYLLDATWERTIRPFTKKILVIDDIANRLHDCDILIDQNFYNNQTIRYKNLLPLSCLQLIGPKYTLLKRDFRIQRNQLMDNQKKIKQLLICFGGSDTMNQTNKAIEACIQLGQTDIIIDVVVGSANPHKEMLKNKCNNAININYHCQINHLAEIMAKANLAIGAGGITTWERCCLGLPSLVISIASNQEQSAHDLSSLGAIQYLGRAEDVSVAQLSTEITNLLHTDEKRLSMSIIGKNLVDGNGCTRVVKKLLSLGG